MQLRWTEDAADDLEHITEYLFENAPGRAAELVLSPLPYIVVYQITGEVIHIARILHGAQTWP
jgi:plasmid stabilization system protein ParE